MALEIVSSARSDLKLWPKTDKSDSDNCFNWSELRRDDGKNDGDANSLIQNFRVVHK